MKIMNVMKKCQAFSARIATMLGLMAFSGVAFADDTGIGTLGQLTSNLDNNTGSVVTLVIYGATMMGIILVVKGLIHLKQHHTGSAQEKHLSKGIASLAIGTFCVIVPASVHMLATTVDASASFSTGVTAVDFS